MKSMSLDPENLFNLTQDLRQLEKTLGLQDGAKKPIRTTSPKEAQIRRQLQQQAETTGIRPEILLDAAEKLQRAKAKRGPQSSLYQPRMKDATEEGAVGRLKYFDSDELAERSPEGEALEIDPVALHYSITPKTALHPWQVEELMRIHGLVDPLNDDTRFQFNPDLPCLYTLSAANGAGKDEFIIARSVVHMALTNYKFRVIITTSSQEQLFRQTCPHIQNYITAINQKMGGAVFMSTKVHHYCTLTGSEIVLYVTNTAGRAEGFHPWTGGRMCLWFNEGKSISDEIYGAVYRCTGYSYFINTSSPPTAQVGEFYNNAKDATPYPEPLVPGKHYLRCVSAAECPHIPENHIKHMLRTRPLWWINSSIHAKLPDADTDPRIIIPKPIWDECIREKVEQVHTTWGIGLDIGGGRSKTCCYVRKGNTVVGRLAFLEKNIIVQARRINDFLAQFHLQDPNRQRPYSFNADANGMGSGVVDHLRATHRWQVTERYNQSPAHDKEHYLNFGAESYWNLRQLVEHKLINPSTHENSDLSKQIVTRKDELLGAGKRRLQDKAKAAEEGYSELDEADALVLCFWSYRAGLKRAPLPAEKPQGSPLPQVQDQYEWRRYFDKPVTRSTGIQYPTFTPC